MCNDNIRRLYVSDRGQLIIFYVLSSVGRMVSYRNLAEVAGSLGHGWPKIEQYFLMGVQLNIS